MPKKPANQKQLVAENEDLRARLEKAEATLREILSGETDALFVSGVAGAQLFTLKGADQSYRTLIENMSEGALTLTSEGLVLYANRRFAGMLRMPLEKVIGSEINTWFAPESRQILQTLLRKDAVDNRREELALAAADGTQVPVYLSVSRLHLDGMPDSLCMVATDLTEQKRNEAILDAEKFARAILEQAADAIVICDETGRIIRASKQAQSFYGKHLIGQLFELAFPLRQLDGTAFLSVGAVDTKHLLSIEARLTHNGQGFDFLVSVGHLNGAQNQLLGSVVTLTDITERKSSELALRKSESQLSEALKIAKVGYWEYEFATDEFVFNDQYYSLHKITAEEAGGYRMSSADFVRRYVHPEDAPVVGQYVQLAFESADPDYSAKIEVRILSGAGETIWAEVRCRVEKDAEGQTIRLLGISQDIAERKQAEENLKLFRTLLDHSSDAIEVIDPLTMRFLDVNETNCRILGYSREEMLALSVFDIDTVFTPELGKTIEAQLRQTGSAHFETVQRRKDGSTFPVEVNATRVELDKPYLLSIARDITERKAAEARINYLNRIYVVLSGINSLIVRVQDRDELFREACQIVVKKGSFRMAMLCMVDRDTNRIVPVASAGKDEELLNMIKDRLSSSEDASTTMVGMAIMEKQAIVSSDSLNDSRVVFGKQYADAGIRSVVVLPLIVSGEAAGTISLYAGEIDFFHEEEMKLLTELAGDIAFAIDHLDKQEKLHYFAYYDALTGLANRTLFLERVAQYMRSAVSGGHKLALCLIDLERFKNINDSMGRQAGDALLKQVAEWLTNSLGDVDQLARIDADHFAMVLPEVVLASDLARLIENMAQAFQEHPFYLNDSVLRLSGKAGIAVFPDDGIDVDTLFMNAEAALKMAKKSGDRYLFHTKKMTEAVAGKLTLENQLRRAIDNEEFVLHYQPKVNMVSGKVTGAEALIRWNDPRTGLVPPGKFIPILEETGLIYEVGRWALHQAIKDYLRWRAAGLPAVRIAVNVSPLQLRSRDFVAEIEQVVGIDAHAAEGLELEITESLIMEDVRHSIDSLQVIRAMGITIAIDDFGTGFSSLSYLAKLPVDTLKIDRAFVIEMTVSPEGLALVSTIISLAHALKFKVVAEGVETEEQSRLLRLLGCDEMQGFLFSKAVPAEIFESRFLVQPPVG